jgi:hypothetical protein
VTVTNLTRGQILSPPVLATHTRQLQPLFSLGSPASDEVVAIAEDAVNDPMVSTLSANSEVKAVEVLKGAQGPILPGETARATIEGGGRFSQISLIGMLVTTNDGFYALEAVNLPIFGSPAYDSPAYDAGSEANNEGCEFIPGPPCGHAGVRTTVGAEGFVHIHAGIHGGGDLRPADFDWRNPVARITLRRLTGAGTGRDH